MLSNYVEKGGSKLFTNYHDWFRHSKNRVLTGHTTRSQSSYWHRLLFVVTVATALTFNALTSGEKLLRTMPRKKNPWTEKFVKPSWHIVLACLQRPPVFQYPNINTHCNSKLLLVFFSIWPPPFPAGFLCSIFNCSKIDRKNDNIDKTKYCKIRV